MDILMPQLGETLAEGTVTHWYKQVGDTVRADEALFDVETDKVSTEIPSPIAGILTEVLVVAGQTVKVGTRLAVVRGANEHSAASAAPASAPRSASPPAAAPDAAARAATAGADPQQKLSPLVRRLLAEHALNAADIHGRGRDGRVTRDDVLNHVASIAKAHESSPRSPVPAGQTPSPTQIIASHHAPQMTATTHSPLPLAEVPAAKQTQEPAATATTSPASGETVVPLNNVRRRSAAAMARAWQVVPHVLQAVEADYSRIEAARRAKGAMWQQRQGFALTYLPFLAWSVSQALLRYGQLNARIDGDTLIVSRRVHLGIAVDLDHDGLVVPVIRDAQDRTVPALAREIRRLSIAARSNQLRPDDFGQPTYTISNSGAFGTLITAPIVNPPQVAILSTDGVCKRPVVVESDNGDSIAIRPVGVLAQSFDHRAVDGAYSAAFLKELKRTIETRNWIDDVS